MKFLFMMIEFLLAFHHVNRHIPFFMPFIHVFMCRNDFIKTVMPVNHGLEKPFFGDFF